MDVVAPLKPVCCLRARNDDDDDDDDDDEDSDILMPAHPSSPPFQTSSVVRSVGGRN